MGEIGGSWFKIYGCVILRLNEWKSTGGSDWVCKAKLNPWCFLYECICMLCLLFSIFCPICSLVLFIMASSQNDPSLLTFFFTKLIFDKLPWSISKHLERLNVYRLFKSGLDYPEGWNLILLIKKLFGIYLQKLVMVA